MLVFENNFDDCRSSNDETKQDVTPDITDSSSFCLLMQLMKNLLQRHVA